MGEGEGHCCSPCDVVISEVLTILYSNPHADTYLEVLSAFAAGTEEGATHEGIRVRVV